MNSRGAQRYKWNFGQGMMEEEDGQRMMQVHSMEIPYNADRLQVTELINSPQMSMPPRSYGHGQRLSPAPSPLLMNSFVTSQQQLQQQLQMQQMQQQMQQMQQEEEMGSPEMKKKSKKKKKTDSPSSSPKGRGRYACLLHRQKHKRCPPDCPERKPKPIKTGSSASSTKKTSPPSPRKAKVQINPIDLNTAIKEEPLVAETAVNAIVIPPHLRPMAYPSLPSIASLQHQPQQQQPQLMPGPVVERISWEAPPAWEDSWNELNPASNWTAWEDLRSSSHWEESKVKVENEFDPSQFLIDDKQLQMSDSPEGSELLSDVAMNDL